MAAQFPNGVSRWQFVGGSWFPVNGANIAPQFRFVVATQFRNGSRMIDAANDGLSVADFQALEQKFPGAVSHVGNDFTLPLVPEGTVVDLTPE
jgi:hypothetical protein